MLLKTKQKSYVCAIFFPQNITARTCLFIQSYTLSHLSIVRSGICQFEAVAAKPPAGG